MSARVRAHVTPVVLRFRACTRARRRVCERVVAVVVVVAVIVAVVTIAFIVAVNLAAAIPFPVRVSLSSSRHGCYYSCRCLVTARATKSYMYHYGSL